MTMVDRLSEISVLSPKYPSRVRLLCFPLKTPQHQGLPSFWGTQERAMCTPANSNSSHCCHSSHR